MKTRKCVRRCLLVATLAGTPLSVAGAETPSVQKTAPQEQRTTLWPIVATALRKVPQPAKRVSDIQLTQYQPGLNGTNGKTSTVNGELRKLFQKNGRPMPSMRTRDLPNANSSAIRMVRHRKDVPEPPESSQEEQAKKPSLLKRFFNRFKAKPSDKDEFLSPGQAAAPAIPSPPPIVFDEGSNTRSGSTGNSVPARVTGFQKGNGQSMFGISQSRIATTSNDDLAQPLIQVTQLAPAESPKGNQPAQKPAGSDSQYQHPTQHQVLVDDGFVNPFGESVPASDDDTLLDLDLLIETSISKNIESPLPTLPEDASELAADQNPFVQEAAAASPQQQPVARQSDATGNIAAELTEESTVSAQTEEVVTDIQPTRTIALETDSETTTNQTQHESEESSVTAKQSQFADEAKSEPIGTSDSETTSKAAWRPSAEAVAGGRVLETPIELKPDPERHRQLSDQARREEQLYRISSRSGQAGFKGFCPVALRDRRELLDGRSEYSSKYGLRTYDFSSPEAQAAFEANPTRYAPAGAGSDVVLLVNTNEEVAGILDFSLWYRDRLYMFRSRETQAIFSGNPQRYASQY
ncbi:MAG: hypothetical protein P8K08_01095 [Fuerstiella sp.]|nr:hypothetical protein [Fuerstiella sp.]